MKYSHEGAEALIEDIETDKRVALKSLERTGYEQFKTDPHFILPNNSRF